jgi:hypothetical protein
MGWPSRLEADEGSNGRGCMWDRKRSSPPAFEATAREEGDARERTRSHEVGGVLDRRKGGYKARTAEVSSNALWEVGGGQSSEEGADNKTRRSEGPLLELCFRWGKGRVTARRAQCTP